MEPGTARLYYNTGKGFSKEESTISNLAGDGRFHDCVFPIPAQSIQGFRFDPAASKGRVTIKNADIIMEIAGNVRMTVQRIDLMKFRPGQQIRELSFKDGELNIAVEENANDPQIAVPASFDAWYRLGIFWHLSLLLLKIIAAGLFCALLMWIWSKWDDHPSGAIAIIALLVFGLRCGPLYVSATSPALNLSIQSSVYGNLQLYYDLGKGLSEGNSIKTLIYPDTDEQIYRMEIPDKRIFNLRIDPPISKDPFVIGDITITDGLGRPLKPFYVDLQNASVNEDIPVFDRRGSMLFLQTKDDAPDPQVRIPLAPPLLAGIDFVYLLIRTVSELLFIAAIALTMVLFCRPERETHRLRWLLLFTSIGILFMRYPKIVLDPRFLAEEGALFFKRAYQSGVTSFSSFFYNHEIVGYYNLIADFASWVAATFFPLRYAPYATLFLSFAFQIFPVYLIAISRNPLWDSPLKKTVGIVLVLLVPISSDIWLTMIGTQYHLGLITFLILLESGERLSRWNTWLFRGMLFIGGFSGISSCLMTPFFFLKALYNRKRETLLQALLLAFAAGLQLLSLWRSSSRLSNLGDPLSFLANMVNANFVSTLMGPAVASDLSQIIYRMADKDPFALAVSLTLLLMLEALFLIHLFRRIDTPGLFLMAVGALLITITASYIGMLNGKWETVDPYNASRYFWLPNVMLAFCVLFAVREKPTFSLTIQSNLLIGFCLLLIVVQGALHYDMTGYVRNMPSWKKETALWMRSDGNRTIALWPQGWQLELEKKNP